MPTQPIILNFMGARAIQECEPILEEITETFGEDEAKIKYGRNRKTRNNIPCLRVVIQPKNQAHARQIIRIVERLAAQPLNQKQGAVMDEQIPKMTLDDWREAGIWDGFHGFPQKLATPLPDAANTHAYGVGFETGVRERVAFDKSAATRKKKK